MKGRRHVEINFINVPWNKAWTRRRKNRRESNLEHELAKEKGTGRRRGLQRITSRQKGETGKERYQKQEKGTRNKEEQRRNELGKNCKWRKRKWIKLCARLSGKERNHDKRGQLWKDPGAREEGKWNNQEEGASRKEEIIERNQEQKKAEVKGLGEKNIGRNRNQE